MRNKIQAVFGLMMDDEKIYECRTFESVEEGSLS